MNRLQNNLYAEINRITARIDYEKEQLQKIMLLGARAMSDWFGVVGIDNLISPKVWEIALDLLREDASSPYKINPDDDDEEIKYRTYWQTKFNVNWNYNMPFTSRCF